MKDEWDVTQTLHSGPRRLVEVPQGSVEVCQESGRSLKPSSTRSIKKGREDVSTSDKLWSYW